MVLDVADLTVRRRRRPDLPVNGLSFQVRAGEILGIAGVQGNGQTELCEALMGLRPIAGGTVTLNGRDLTHASPRDRLRAGIAYVPEDRTEDGLVGAFSVAENLILDMYDRPPFASGINLQPARDRARTRPRGSRSSTSAPARPPPPAGTLSGGNQQKVILARELGREHKVLIASQPTRGLDVGSIEFVHRRIVEQRDHGVAVVIVSSELDEIYALADRIAVMYEGKITGFRDPDVPAAELGRLMAGGADSRGRAPAAVMAPAPEARDPARGSAPTPAPRRHRPGPGSTPAPRRAGGSVTTPPEAEPPSPTAPPAGGSRAAGESAAGLSGHPPRSFSEGNTVTVTVLALLAATVLGGLLAAFTNDAVLHA